MSNWPSLLWLKDSLPDIRTYVPIPWWAEKKLHLSGLHFDPVSWSQSSILEAVEKSKLSIQWSCRDSFCGKHGGRKVIITRSIYGYNWELYQHLGCQWIGTMLPALRTWYGAVQYRCLNKLVRERTRLLRVRVHNSVFISLTRSRWKENNDNKDQIFARCCLLQLRVNEALIGW